MNGHFAESLRCPLYSQKRTFLSATWMSAKCQKRRPRRARSKGRPPYNPQMLRLGRGLKAHEVRGDAKPTTISPFVDIRVATKPNITVQPLIPVTRVNDRNVTQNPYHHVHGLCFRPRVWIGDALQKRFAIQQSSIWSRYKNPRKDFPNTNARPTLVQTERSFDSTREALHDRNCLIRLSGALPFALLYASNVKFNCSRMRCNGKGRLAGQMSALGQKRTSRSEIATSALPSNVDTVGAFMSTRPSLIPRETN
jgi:hypothetical protein